MYDFRIKGEVCQAKIFELFRHFMNLWEKAPFGWAGNNVLDPRFRGDDRGRGAQKKSRPKGRLKNSSINPGTPGSNVRLTQCDVAGDRQDQDAFLGHHKRNPHLFIKALHLISP